MNLLDRLILENKILASDGLDQFQVYVNKSDNTYYLTGTHYTNAGNSYVIYSPIPYGYPYSRPKVYIKNPNPLRSYDYSKSINSYGVSHRMHTLGNGPSGEVQICHWRDEKWHSGITLNKVLLKTVIWLEAYEQHLLTGKDICDFVTTMKESA